jgi:hypothetical protein
MKKWEWVALLATIGMLAIGSAGCKSNPLAGPSLAFVNTVGVEYLAYVEADDKLDADAKKARRVNVEAFKLLAEEANK